MGFNALTLNCILWIYYLMIISLVIISDGSLCINYHWMKDSVMTFVYVCIKIMGNWFKSIDKSCTDFNLVCVVHEKLYSWSFFFYLYRHPIDMKVWSIAKSSTEVTMCVYSWPIYLYWTKATEYFAIWLTDLEINSYIIIIKKRKL